MDELRQLRYFVAVARELHFTRAAKALHLAQPALSRNIRQLEEYVGTPLFDRTSRSVNLTAAGKVFLGEALRLIEQMEISRNAAFHAAPGHGGTLSIGFTSSSILGDFPRLVTLFFTRYPNVSVTFRELTNEECVLKLLSGALDLACTESRVFDARIQSVPMAPVCLFLAVRKDHRFARRTSVRLEECSGEKLIFPTYYPLHALFTDLTHACNEAGFSPNVVAQTLSQRSAIELVAAGAGIAPVTKNQALAHPSVVILKIRGTTFKVERRLNWRSDDLSPTVANFLRLR